MGNSAEELTVVRDAAKGGYEPAAGFFTGSEPLECALWAGDDRTQAATLPCSWLDAPNATIKVEFPAASMTGLDVDWYQGRVVRTDISQLLIRFRVEIEAGPGTATRPPAYHAYADLTAELPLVAKLADHLQDQGGFAELSGQARKWIDRIVAGSAITGGYGQRFLASPCWPWGDDSLLRQDVLDALAAGKLVVDERINRASVCWTLSTILKRSVGYKTANDLAAMGKEYGDEANRLMAGGTARIMGDDGYARYVLSLGCVRVRRA